MFKNDERYWDINLLNKWFAISSIVFLLVLVWIFIDDNDDEFKEYQKEFRKLQIEIAETKLNEEKSLVEGKSEDYELELARAVKLYDDKSEKVKNINSELGVLRAGFYKVNLKYAEKKAKIDVLKFELESANLKDAKKAENASEALKLIPDDLVKMGICDRIIDEPNGGAHRDFISTANLLKVELLKQLNNFQTYDRNKFLESRIKRYDNLGYFIETL